MIGNMILNPNCSEAVMRFNTADLNESEKKQLEEALKEVNIDKGNTSLFRDTIFGIPAIVVKGALLIKPFN